MNESWLVALSALEDSCVAPPTPAIPSGINATPGSNPLSVDFSPFDLPETLNTCTLQLQQKCACGLSMSCAHEPTDQTFSDANAECTWVNQQSENASAICILGLLSLDNVKECVESAPSPCTVMPLKNRDDAVLFASSARCITILDNCLDHGDPENSSPSSSCSGDSCDDCDVTATDCKNALEICVACAEICAACAQNADRKTAADESAFKFATVHSVNYCSVRPQSAKSPLPAPVGAALWLFAPVAYLLSRSRRRM